MHLPPFQLAQEGAFRLIHLVMEANCLAMGKISNSRTLQAG